MVMRKSSDEHLAAIKAHFDSQKRVKYEELLQRHFYRQVVSNEKKTEYYMRLKLRAQELDRRHREAAARRKIMMEEKQSKILARKQYRSESRESKSSSFSEVISSSKPGVFVTRIVSPDGMQGTAGFGRGYVKKPEVPAAAEQRSTWSGSAVSTADEPVRSLTRSSESDQFTSYTNDRASLSDWTACSDISENHSSCQAAPFIIQDVDMRMSPEIKYIIPEKQLRKFIDESRKYRALKSLKKVSFDSAKSRQKVCKPVIKKSLQLDTPETKRGILLKMTEVNAKRKLEPNLKCGSEVSSLPKLTGGVHKQISLAGRGDSMISTPNEAGCTGGSAAVGENNGMARSGRSSAPMRTFRDDTVSCGRLLQTRDYEKSDRKCKLSQLQEDLRQIEIETKRLSCRNAEISRGLRAKETEYKT